MIILTCAEDNSDLEIYRVFSTQLFIVRFVRAARTVRFLERYKGRLMNRSNHSWPNHIFLIDNHPLTTLLIFRMCNHLNYKVTHSEKEKQLPKLSQENNFDLIMMNLSFPFKNEFMSQWNQYFLSSIPVIYYTPKLVITDFMQVSAQNTCINDDQWMLDSNLFQFIKKLSVNY